MELPPTFLGASGHLGKNDRRWDLMQTETAEIQWLEEKRLLGRAREGVLLFHTQAGGMGGVPAVGELDIE